MALRRIALPVLVAALLLAVFGCNGRKKATGPQFVAIIVDTSASCASLRPQLIDYAKLALTDYAAKGKIKVTIINLNESPSVEFQKEGEFYDEDIDEIIKHVKDIHYNAKGTDIISAFDCAQKYYSYEKVTPRSFKILCFTDGLIDPAKGRTCRKWSEFDWKKLNTQGASVGLYFIDPKVRDDIESSLKALGAYFVQNRNDAIDALKNEEAKIP